MAIPEPRAPFLPAQYSLNSRVPDAAAGASLSELTVEFRGTDGDYESTEWDGDASGVRRDTLVTLGVDRGSDNRGLLDVDEDFSDDVTGVEASASSVTVSLNGSYAVESGDELVVEFHGVTNPSEGEYEVETTINGRESVVASTSTFRQAGVLFHDQDVDSDGVATVRSAFLPQGGFVAVRTLERGSTEIKGVSEPLERGGHTDVEVPLSDVLSGTHQTEAVLFRDSDSDGRLDTDADNPYTKGGDHPVMSPGELTVRERIPERSTPTPTDAGGETQASSPPEPSGTEAAGRREDTASPSSDPTETGPQRGFFTNGDMRYEFLDSFTLTVGGFVLSAAGIVHQMLKGN